MLVNVAEYHKGGHHEQKCEPTRCFAALTFCANYQKKK